MLRAGAVNFYSDTVGWFSLAIPWLRHEQNRWLNTSGASDPARNWSMMEEAEVDINLKDGIWGAAFKLKLM